MSKTTSILFTLPFCLFLAVTTAANSSEVAEKKETPDTYTLCVSPSGNDSWSGLRAKNVQKDGPFKTLARTQIEIKRILDKTNGKAAVNVKLAPGRHVLQDTLKFNTDYARPGDGTITFTSLSDDYPIISGGMAITGWTVHDKDRNIWVANLSNYPQKDRLVKSRSMYADDIHLVRAKSDRLQDYQEKHGHILVHDKRETGSQYSLRLAAKDPALNATLQDIANWGNPTDMELVDEVSSTHTWVSPRALVTAIAKGSDSSLAHITISPGCYKWLYSFERDMSKIDWIENAFELLDRAGEWYLDKPAQKVFYIPPDCVSPNDQDIILPHLNRLIEINGDETNLVRNITFANLSFRHANWSFANYGYYFWQANHFKQVDPRQSRLPMTAIKVANSEFIEFDNVEFTNLAISAVELGGKHSRIRNSHFHNLGSGAILCFGGQHNEFSRNHVHNIGKDYPGAVGIDIRNAPGTVIRDNSLYNLPYSGVHIYPSGGDATIVDNIVENPLYKLSDGGGIYVKSGHPLRSLIKGNYITGQRYDLGSIYLDDVAKNITVRENVILNTPWGFVAKGVGHLFEDNWWSGRVLVRGRSRAETQKAFKVNHSIGSIHQLPDDLKTHVRNLQALKREFQSSERRFPASTINILGVTAPKVVDVTEEMHASAVIYSRKRGRLDAGRFSLSITSPSLPKAIVAPIPALQPGRNVCRFVLKTPQIDKRYTYQWTLMSASGWNYPPFRDGTFSVHVIDKVSHRRGTNLIKNGDFKNGSRHWSAVQWARAQVETEDVPYPGAIALRNAPAGYSNYPKGSLYQRYSDAGIKQLKGRDFTLGVWARKLSDNKKGVMVGLEAVYTDGTQGKVQRGITPGWNYYELTLTTDPSRDLEHVQVNLFSWQPATPGLFCDVYLSVHGTRKLIANGDFAAWSHEKNAACPHGWSLQGFAEAIKEKEDIPYSGAIVLRNAPSGHKDYPGNSIFQRYSHPGIRRLNGRTFEASFWARKPTGRQNVTVGLEIVYTDGSQDESKMTIGKPWKYYRMQLAADPKKDLDHIQFNFHSDGSTQGLLGNVQLATE